MSIIQAQAQNVFGGFRHMGVRDSTSYYVDHFLDAGLGLMAIKSSTALAYLDTDIVCYASGSATITLDASAGTVVTTGAITSSAGIAGTTGTYSGAVSGTTGTFSGAVSGTTGTFSGAVAGTTGTFSGAVAGTTGTFSGAVAGTTGTFSGAVSGTTGTFSGDVAVTGTLIGDAKIVAITTTANESITAAMSGSVFTIDSSGGACTIVLPAAASGLWYRFYVKDATTASTIAAPAATMYGGILMASTGATDNNVEISAGTTLTMTTNAGIGDYIGITCDGTNWYVYGRSGHATGWSVA